jgi:F-type H+-transporting ATPase subunit b
LEQLGINLGFLLSQLVNFILLVVLLRLVLYKPTLNMLRQRQERIARSMADADAARESAAKSQQEYDRRLVEAQRKAQEIVGQAAQQAEQVAAGIRAEAQRDAEAIREKARQEAQEEKGRVLSEVQSQIASLSMLATERVLRQGLDEKTQRQLIEQSLRELAPGANGGTSQKGA